jgi:C4-dicarboxylate-specific signal transduction histidine kinase
MSTLAHRTYKLKGEFSKLKRGAKALEDRREVLEQQVEERTAELAEANMRLQQEIVNRERAEQILFEEKERAQVTSFRNSASYSAQLLTR